MDLENEWQSFEIAPVVPFVFENLFDRMKDKPCIHIPCFGDKTVGSGNVHINRFSIKDAFCLMANVLILNKIPCLLRKISMFRSEG